MITPNALVSLNFPVQTILVRKCGASFLCNLFYFFDNFKLSPKPLNLETGERLHFEYPLPRVSPIGDFRFVFYRNPLDRFVDFYFDQLYFDGPEGLPDLRKRLMKFGFVRGDFEDTKMHQRNLAILIEYVERKSRKDGLIQLPDTLAPQYKTLLPAIDHGFEQIDLARANFQLELMLVHEIPMIKKYISRVSRRVKPLTEYPVTQVVTPDVARRHQSLYAADFELYWAKRDGQT